MQFLATSLHAFHGRVSDDPTTDGIRAWHQRIATTVQQTVGAELVWAASKGDAAGIEVPQVAWRAVRLLAAHAQCANFEWPDWVPETLEDDPAWGEASEADFARFQYPQVVIPDCWLPGDFACTLDDALPDGEPAILGSLHGLHRQLRTLNQNTLSLPPDGVDSRLLVVPPSGDVPGGDFVANASFALGALLWASGYAREHGLVLLRRP